MNILELQSKIKELENKLAQSEEARKRGSQTNKEAYKQIHTQARTIKELENKLAQSEEKLAQTEKRSNEINEARKRGSQTNKEAYKQIHTQARTIKELENKLAQSEEARNSIIENNQKLSIKVNVQSQQIKLLEFNKNTLTCLLDEKHTKKD